MGRLRTSVRAAATVAAIGVFLTWTTTNAITLDGTQGPNNGWLVVIVAAFALDGPARSRAARASPWWVSWGQES